MMLDPVSLLANFEFWSTGKNGLKWTCQGRIGHFDWNTSGIPIKMSYYTTKVKYMASGGYSTSTRVLIRHLVYDIARYAV